MSEDTGRGYPAAFQNEMVIRSSSDASLAWLPAGLPQRVKLILAPSTSLCIQRMDVVTLR